MRNKRRWAHGEKRMLWWSSGVCVVALGLGALYEWNNRVPDLDIPQAAPPADNAYDYYVRAVELYPVPNAFTPVAAKGAAIDGQFDHVGGQPPLYSAAYRARYPVARQRAYLRANGAALGEVRAGLKLPYLQAPERGLQSANGIEHRTLARLLLVESHALAGENNWDGAADSLSDVHKLGAQTSHGGAWRSYRSSEMIRKMARDELWQVMPHLSAAKAREVARRLENSATATPAQALEEEKRATQSFIVELTRKRDWRGLYISYGCIGGCDVSDEELQRALNDLPALLKMRLAWMNKAAVLDEYTRNMNQQIARERQPYGIESRYWPMTAKYESDAVQQMIHLQLSTWNYYTTTAQDRLLTAALALHAYHLDKGVYPRTLSKLVPKYLARVPLDPFSDEKPLLYKPVTKRYVTGFRIVPAPGAPPNAGPDPGGVTTRQQPLYAYKPFTLWSRGLNARDDDGSSCIQPNIARVLRRYMIEPAMREKPCDIVAGINR